MMYVLVGVVLFIVGVGAILISRSGGSSQEGKDMFNRIKAKKAAIQAETDKSQAELEQERDKALQDSVEALDNAVKEKTSIPPEPTATLIPLPSGHIVDLTTVPQDEEKEDDSDTESEKLARAILDNADESLLAD